MSLIDLVRARASDSRLRTDMVIHGGGFSSTVLHDSTISRAEDRLGLRLPPLLKSAYREIGNGGFGPGYGLLPLASIAVPADVETVVDLYLAFKGSDSEDAAWCWPDHLVPICDWGCAIRSCVDCGSPEGRVVTFDPNSRGRGVDMSVAFAPTHASLDAWFGDWITGVRIWDVMFQLEPDAAEIMNPFTRKRVSVSARKLRRPLGQ